jgi:small subunit ribosomal protein S20
MANNPSAIKRIRQTETRTLRNKALTSRMKSLRKKTIASAEAGDKEAAQKNMSEFASAVDKCVKNSIIHKNKAANIKSKTSKHLVS